MASKSKKSKQKPPPLRSNLTVRECMTWHFQKGYVAEPEQQTADQQFHLPTRGDLGRPKNRGYDMDNMPPHMVQAKPDDGTVIEALRGWPNHRRSDDDGYGCQGDDLELPPINGQDQGKSDKGDPWMNDLISHRFMNDALRKRQQEEQEAAEKAAAARAKRSVKGQAEAKGNRTSQLRAIALAERVQVDPKDLWQLPKFKNKARPHLTTTEKKQKLRKGSAWGGGGGGAARGGSASGRQGSATGGDPCLCNTEPEIKDYDAYLDSLMKSYQPHDYGATSGDVDPVFKEEQCGNEIYAV